MNKYFDREEYGMLLFNELIHDNVTKKYNSTDLYLMASAGIHKCNYTSKEVEDIIYCHYVNRYGKCNAKIYLDDIHKQVKRAESCKAFNVPALKITEEELNKIKSCDGLERQKVLFTILCLAKYNNLIKTESTNWISTSSKKIFDYANVHMSNLKKEKMIYDLKTTGLINNSMKITSNNIHVNFVDTAGPVILTIKDLRGLGNMYVAYLGGTRMKGKTLKLCSGCGTPFLDSTTKRNLFYCPKCQRLRHS